MPPQPTRVGTALSQLTGKLQAMGPVDPCDHSPPLSAPDRPVSFVRVSSAFQSHHQSHNHGCTQMRSSMAKVLNIIDISSDSEDNDEYAAMGVAARVAAPAAGIRTQLFKEKALELADVMESHEVSGYGNVLTAMRAVLKTMSELHETSITRVVLDKLAHDGVPRMPTGKTVHKWFSQIIDTGDCTYIAHIKETRRPARRRRL